MSTEPMTVPADDVRKKLEQYTLKLTNSYGQLFTYQFADFLATQLRGETISPEYFLMEVELSFAALKRGTDASTGKMIAHCAADRVPAAERFVRMDMPAIIEAIFPPEFAAEVTRVQAEVLEEAKAMRV